MIKIGDFARLGQVTVVTLRHYDEKGLLSPAEVDAFTGYRYYSISQLTRLHRILALKDLGFSLDEIRQTLEAGLTAEALNAMLTAKRREGADRIQDEQARLDRIDARLRQIERENLMPDYDVVLKTVPAMLVAYKKVHIPTNDQVSDLLSPAFDEVYGYVKDAADGPGLAVWHSPADVFINEVVDAVAPLKRKVEPKGDIVVEELPEVTVASAVHQGVFDEFTQAHVALLTWIEENGYRVTGPYRELYLHYNREDLTDSTTEVQFPVEKA